MNKFLFKLLSAFISKENSFKLKEKELQLKIELSAIESDYANKRMRNGYYTQNELTEVEKNLFYKKAELKNISDSMRLDEQKINSEKNELMVKFDMQVALNSNRSLEIARLEKIIEGLTKQLGNKVEIIK